MFIHQAMLINLMPTWRLYQNKLALRELESLWKEEALEKQRA
jgi:hypothetical protein